MYACTQSEKRVKHRVQERPVSIWRTIFDVLGQWGFSLNPCVGKHVRSRTRSKCSQKCWFLWRIQGRRPRTCVSPPWGPNSFIFIQFSAKNLKNNRLAHQFWGLLSQENPGSATGFYYILLNISFIVYISKPAKTKFHKGVTKNLIVRKIWNIHT